MDPSAEKVDHMLTDRFVRLFDRLVARWHRYQDAPRDPERVVELATARAQLDDVRNKIALERVVISSQAPTIEPPRVAVSDLGLHKLKLAGIGLDGHA